MNETVSTFLQEVHSFENNKQQKFLVDAHSFENNYLNYKASEEFFKEVHNFESNYKTSLISLQVKEAEIKGQETRNHSLQGIISTNLSHIKSLTDKLNNVESMLKTVKSQNDLETQLCDDIVRKLSLKLMHEKGVSKRNLEEMRKECQQKLKESEVAFTKLLEKTERDCREGVRNLEAKLEVVTKQDEILKNQLLELQQQNNDLLNARQTYETAQLKTVASLNDQITYLNRKNELLKTKIVTYQRGYEEIKKLNADIMQKNSDKANEVSKIAAEKCLIEERLEILQQEKKAWARREAQLEDKVLAMQRERQKNLMQREGQFKYLTIEELIEQNSILKQVVKSLRAIKSGKAEYKLEPAVEKKLESLEELIGKFKKTVYKHVEENIDSFTE